VTLHKKWKTELRKAALAILRGGLWVPSQVLLAFVKQMKTLLDTQLSAGQFTDSAGESSAPTAFRHLTNKEIAYQLNICDRTAQFHVSNILRKLGIETRSNLLASFFGELITRNLPGNKFDVRTPTLFTKHAS